MPPLFNSNNYSDSREPNSAGSEHEPGKMKDSKWGLEMPVPDIHA